MHLDSNVSQRIARARLLAERHSSAAHILSFYAELVSYQFSLADEKASGVEEAAVAHIPAFLEWLGLHAPASLSRSAADLKRLSREQWRRAVARAFTDTSAEIDPGGEVARFVAEAMLQPWAERAARATNTPRPVLGEREDEPAAARCPACACLPVVAVLREEGHGARRALVCARCAGEWMHRRVECPGCGERTFDALPVFTAEQFGHVRIDACDRCRRFLKTVDLTKDGLAVPLVDDLASLSLDLWARSQGYERLRPNLLRV